MVETSDMSRRSFLSSFFEKNTSYDTRASFEYVLLFHFLVGVTRSIEMLFTRAWMMIHVEIRRVIH